MRLGRGTQQHALGERGHIAGGGELPHIHKKLLPSLDDVDAERFARAARAARATRKRAANLFLHPPADFTDHAGLHDGRLALKYDELTDLDCLVATLSVDPV